ncbi:hypothetical protein ACLOJK_040578 [Asimina triloba]
MMLEDAERQQLKDGAVQDWLRKLKDAVACSEDDVLDQFTTEALRRKSETRGQLIKKLRDFFAVSNPVGLRLRMAHKIKKINSRLDAIAGERSKFHSSQRQQVAATSSSR